MRELRLHRHIDAPPAAVWAVYTDHVGYMRWAGIKEVVLRQQGDPPPNGLGAIRVLRERGIAIEEEVIGWEPPRRMQYRLVSGIPVRDYLGETLFEPEGTGTSVTWIVRFRPLIPGTGWLLQRAVQGTLSRMIERLAQLDYKVAR